MKTKILIILVVLIGLGVAGIVFSLDKVVEAEEETYDTCISFCGVKRDNVSCLRECDIKLRSCVMGCPGGLIELIECANVCTYYWIIGRCNPICYEDYDNALKDTPYVGASPPFLISDKWEREPVATTWSITRPYDYSGCVEECKKYFLFEEPVVGSGPSVIIPSGVSEEEPIVTVMKKVKAFFATSTGITGGISFSWIVGPIIFLIIVGVVIYFFLKKKKLPRLKTRR